MKNVAVVWSSPNTDGLTASAKDQFVKGLVEAGAQVTQIHLNSKRIEHCQACNNGWGTCRTEGTCVIKDDFAEICEVLRKADGVVWISAVYWWDTTECFKAFFDRLRRGDAAVNHAMADKPCALIACAGGTGRGAIECLQQMEKGATHIRMKTVDRTPVIRYNKDYILPALCEAGKAFAVYLSTTPVA